MATLEGSVDLMENVVRHIVEIVVTSGMYHPELSVNELFIYVIRAESHKHLRCLLNRKLSLHQS